MIPEALRELTRHAFEELDLAALWGSCFVENAASRRVMEKCGFRLVRTEADLLRDVEGRMRRGEIRRLTRGAWRELHADRL